ncbi:hypothetical protein OESDEN_17792 [Oesophagostomum dentatum]|uniref:Uncharacterized protein n=1 Tax=Oesophagostomum dentatum TaxID=61180 RepID=A0A0B1SC69_OESDE|nr:hypothetical protein OESDEN_17792 [Oesophagostomum dentatum]
MHEKDLFTNRGCVIKRNAWNAEIPLRTDKTAFADDAPYMICTEGSLDELNTRLKDKACKHYIAASPRGEQDFCRQ